MPERRQPRALERVDGDVDERARPVADLLAVVEHRRLVLLALRRSRRRPASRRSRPSGASGRPRPGRRRSCLPADPTRGTHRCRLGDPHELEREVPVRGRASGIGVVAGSRQAKWFSAGTTTSRASSPAATAASTSAGAAGNSGGTTLSSSPWMSTWETPSGRRPGATPRRSAPEVLLGRTAHELGHRPAVDPGVVTPHEVRDPRQHDSALDRHRAVGPRHGPRGRDGPRPSGRGRTPDRGRGRGRPPAPPHGRRRRRRRRRSPASLPR